MWSIIGARFTSHQSQNRRNRLSTAHATHFSAESAVSDETLENAAECTENERVNPAIATPSNVHEVTTEDQIAPRF